MNLAINDPSGIVKVEQVNQEHVHVKIDEHRFLELPQSERTSFVTAVFSSLSEATMNGWRNTYLENCFDFDVKFDPKLRDLIADVKRRSKTQNHQ